MSILDAVVQKIQLLPLTKQQTVLDFIDFLVQGLQPSARVEVAEVHTEATFAPQSSLGQKLHGIRQKALHEGMIPTSLEDINAEIADHRRRDL